MLSLLTLEDNLHGLITEGSLSETEVINLNRLFGGWIDQPL